MQSLTDTQLFVILIISGMVITGIIEAITGYLIRKPYSFTLTVCLCALIVLCFCWGLINSPF